MLLAKPLKILNMPKVWINTLFVSVAVISTFAITGCASKPQINNPTRYAKAPDFYTVRPGDTLSSISARYGLNYMSVAEMNDIGAPYRIYVKQSLRLRPSANRNISRSTTSALSNTDNQIQRQKIQLPSNQSTYSASSVATAPTVSNIPATSPAVRATSLRWVKPSTGPILENFNNATNVKGIRFGGNVGDPVVAAADGQVVYAADGLKEYGNLVLIKHIDGYITAYAHNSKLLVSSGQNVTAGQKVAEMGSSGTTRTMMEFQVRLDGKPINPANILPIN